MRAINIDISQVYNFILKKDVEEIKNQIFLHQQDLHYKSGVGRDFLGWVNLPSLTTKDDLNKIEATADRVRSIADYVVVTGIGGSYLGARAVIEALTNSFDCMQTERKHPVILYAGQNISDEYLHELLDFLNDKSFAILVISKSGTTTEPAIAFRLLKALMEKKYDAEEIKQRIVAITDKSKGALRTLADRDGYETFVIPDNVGGRYSVLTPVGLLPIAIAGIDIRKLIEGAKFMEERLLVENYNRNSAAHYAAVRNVLYKKGKKIEILVNFNPKLHYFGEWWKQLFGESEGKEQKGIFTASVDFTTDLHSLGQWIQDGERTIFETVISIENPKYAVEIPRVEDDLDQLNYLAGKRIDEVNNMAELGTMQAHVDGGVPNIRIALPELNEFYLGQLIYFFEKACGISGYMLGVNPFDQPGVEAYKKNMFKLLGKP
jgi:glucose-6-phosphate isomerase